MHHLRLASVALLAFSKASDALCIFWLSFRRSSSCWKASGSSALPCCPPPAAAGGLDTSHAALLVICADTTGQWKASLPIHNSISHSSAQSDNKGHS